jgi:N-glycosylase/DNA lyase
MILQNGQWRCLSVSPKELKLDLTLPSGQSFRWKQTAQNEWSNVINNHVITLKQLDNDVQYRMHHRPEDKDTDIGPWLRDYFQLDVSLDELYTKWSEMDTHFKSKSHLQGVRVLRQDPVENLFSFICTSNNNIPRITLMISNLERKYGEFLGTVNSIPPVDMYAFPTIQALAQDIEPELRELGFGYRAKFISQTAKTLAQKDNPTEFLHSLRSESYDVARAELLKLTGIGPKVADCIALMSLDKTDVVPVDVHVKKIAMRDYGLKIEAKSLTGKAYMTISNHFKDLFGPFAGWTHSVLFTADLLAPDKPKKSVGKSDSLKSIKITKKYAEKTIKKHAEKITVKR